MTPHPLFAAFFGGWETMIFILVGFVLPLTMVAVICGIIYLLLRRRQPPPPNPPVVPTPSAPAQTAQAPQSNCPHCGKPVPPTALGGICPECMLKAGLATQTEGPRTSGPHGTKVVHPPPSTAEIAALFPQLEILECLGRGGMGVVYKARQPRLNRFVALKILAREKEQDAQFAGRFTREAQALARLNHPNIVTVHDFGEAGGHCYLVMEFVDGLNLRQLLQTGKMKPDQALTIVPKICEALQYAHEQGIVHRDIKPENILLDKSGRVKIADFGIAKMMGDEPGQQTLTGAKDAVGTPHYMAPEQIEKPLTVDHRADIYSLGVVFYEMLTGELPLGKFQPPSAKVQIDVRLDEVVLHALEKEPGRRYQHVSQVKTAVETIATTPAGAGSAEPITAAQIEAARNQLKIPARGLVAAGALQLLFSLGLLIFAMPAIAHEGGDPAGYAAVGFGAALLSIAGVIVLLGAARMMKLRNYPFSIVAGIDAAVTGPGAILGLPFGIWALILLFRREVRAAFEANQQDRNPEYRRPARFGSAWKFAAFIFVLILSYELTRTVFSHLIAGHFHPIKSDYIGQTWFPGDDLIEITSVERTENQMTVRGHYHLVSHNQALLALYITTTNNIAVPVGLKEQMQISKGRGDFELIHPYLVPGLPHVSMYADGHPFASIYFGTMAEALEESKAGWITNTTPAAQFSERFDVVIRRERNAPASTLQFRLVLPKDSTEPADDLPAVSGRERFQLARQVLLDDTAIAQAGVDFDPFGRRMIEIRFTDTGARKFEAITAANIGRQLAIVFRGRVLSAPVIQSVIPGGECQVNGSMDASEIDQIVDCLNRTTTPTSEAWNFSPVQERMLPFNPQPNALFGWLDLDSGRVLTNSTLDWQSRSSYDWIRAHGLDVVTTPSAKHFPTLLGIDMIIAPAPTNGWDMVTPADVIHDWPLLQAEPQQQKVFSAIPGQTDTFIFQTREGGKGVLQIPGFAGDSRGVKVRYKLVRPAAPGTTIDPTTGLPLPAAVTNTSIDPTTGLPMSPGETGTIDPVTGLPVTPAVPKAATNAVVIAGKWLALIDRGNYSESWKEASAIVQGAVTETAWENATTTFRKPLGNLVSREVKSAQLMTELPGAPDGQYVVMQFATSFANKKTTIETVTFMREKDGQWKSAGYFIK